MLGNIYVIGPVTGKRNDNRPAFDQARCNLNAAGYYVQIPHDYIASGTPWDAAMLTSIHIMTEFMIITQKHGSYKRVPTLGGIATLPGWEDSPGARLEAQVAKAIGLPVKTVAEWVEVAR